MSYSDSRGNRKARYRLSLKRRSLRIDAAVDAAEEVDGFESTGESSMVLAGDMVGEQAVWTSSRRAQRAFAGHK